MKKAILFATTLALALGARAETVKSVGSALASNDGTVSPPIIIVGPNAPKPAPVVHYSEIATSDSGTLPPIKNVGPTSPKPVAHYSEIADARNGTLLPPIVVIRPTDPKKLRPAADYSEVASSDSGTLPPIKSVGPTSPKPVAHYSEIVLASNDGTVSPPIIINGPNAPTKPAPVAHFAAND